MTPQQWDDRFVFSGFLASPEVVISSWLAWHPLTNRLEAATCKGERESDQLKIETQAPSKSC